MSSFSFAPLIRPDLGTTANRDAVRKGTYRSWYTARHLVLVYEDNDDNDVQCTAIAHTISIFQSSEIHFYDDVQYYLQYFNLRTALPAELIKKVNQKVSNADTTLQQRITITITKPTTKNNNERNQPATKNNNNESN